MGVLVGLGVGCGLLVMWLALTDNRSTRAPRARRSVGAVRDLLVRAGASAVSPAAFIASCAVTGALTGLSLFVVSATAPIGAVFAVLGSYAPVALLRGRARRRQRELADVWPEAVDNLASAVRAGLSLPEALTQLGERGPEPLREPFRSFGADYLASGRFGDALDRLKAALADPVGDRVVEALRIAREVGGGDLGRMLRSLSGFLRDDARTRAELESRQAWTVNGARLAVAAPWLVLLMLSFQRDVIHRYSSATGALILATGALTCVVAYRLMIRLGRLPAERRVLG
jgi:tight adherence protein B